MMNIAGKILCVAGIATALVGCVTPPSHPIMCRVDARPKTPAAAELSMAVGSMVRGDLTHRGYFVPTDRYVSKKNQEKVSIDLVFDRREAARLEKWVAYDATVSAKVVAGNGRLLGEKTFEARGGRGSTVPDVEVGIRKSLASQLMSWLPEILPPPVAK